MRWDRVIVALGLALLWGAQVGCSTKVCTLKGCPLPFEVRFNPAGERWSAGTYEVSVTADGRSGRCVVTLPFASCGGPPPTCEGDRAWELETSGCALPAENHAIAGIMFGIGSSPSSVEIVIKQGERELAAATYAPQYVTYEPNGPGCGDLCMTAPAASLSVGR